MPGPPPKHPSTRARRNGSEQLRVISGIDGPVPPWPLQPDLAAIVELETAQARADEYRAKLADCTNGRKRAGLTRQLDKAVTAAKVIETRIQVTETAERELWAELWAMPQASLWEEAHAHRAVALYARLTLLAEQGSLPAASEARQRGAALGMTPLDLLKLRAEVERTEEVETKGQQRRTRNSVAKSEAKGDPRAILKAM